MEIFWDLPAYLFLILLTFSVIIFWDRTKRKKSPHKPSSSIALFAKDLYWVVVIIFILRSFLFEPFRIPSGSMLPNLNIGDFVLVNKSAYEISLPLFNYPIYKTGEVKRGDVVVFRYPKDPNIPFIKRVIGLPGDKLSYIDKVVYINDEEIKSEYIRNYDFENVLYKEYLNETSIDILKNPFKNTSKNAFLELQEGISIPEDYFLVMGDNRDNSNDSRYWGYVPRHYFLGKANYVLLNITTDGDLITTNVSEFLKFFSTMNINFSAFRSITAGYEKDE